MESQKMFSTLKRMYESKIEQTKESERFKELFEYALDYAHAIALVLPMTLFPSPFPKQLFNHAKVIQEALNELYFRVSLDHGFLMNALRSVAKGDPFIRRLCEIAELSKNGRRQKIVLALQRSEYMPHMVADGVIELKQLETNIGQFTGPSLAVQITEIHERILDKACPDFSCSDFVPGNRSCYQMADAIFESWRCYGDPNCGFLVVIPDGNKSLGHQWVQFRQWVQFEVEKISKEKMKRPVSILKLTPSDCRKLIQSKRLFLDDDNSLILIDEKGNKCCIGLVHCDWGSLPKHYPTDFEWELRTMFELSNAIVQPTVHQQLAGTKKIQQVLSKPGVLERFMPRESEKVAEIRQTFTELWSLEKSGDDCPIDVIEKAIKSPNEFVLKAQMQQGKGVYFGNEMVKKLRGLSDNELGAHILQSKIRPYTTKNYLFYPYNEPLWADITTELGIFGSLIGNASTGEILRNSTNGHVLRSKSVSENEGLRVSDGHGVYDSVLLF